MTVGRLRGWAASAAAVLFFACGSAALADVERTVVARSGEPAVGFPAGSWINTIAFGGQVRPMVNNRGHVVLHGTAVGNNLPLESNDAIWLATRDGLVLVLREDAPFPGDGNVRFSSWVPLGISDDDGVLILAALRGDVTSGNNSALCRVYPDRPVEVIARTGDFLPDSSDEFWIAFVPPTGYNYPVNSHGDIAIRALTNRRTTGDWYETRAGALHRMLLVGFGQSVPGTPEGTFVTQATLSGWSESGIGLFNVILAGGGTTTLNDSAVVAASRNGAQLIIREGDPVPGIPGATIGGPPSSGPLMAHALDTQFFHYSMIEGASSPALWTGTISAPEVLVRQGDRIPGSAGTFHGFYWMEGGPEGNAFCGGTSVGGNGIWIERDGEIVTLSRTGQPAPEVEVDVTFANVPSIGDDGPVRLSRHGRAAFAATLSGPVPPGATLVLYQTDATGARRRVVRLRDMIDVDGMPMPLLQIYNYNVSSRGYVAAHVSLGGNSILLAKVSCPAAGCDATDFDGDCRVTLDDLSTLLSNFGDTSLDPFGDTDGDHDVDLADLANTLSAFGNDCRQ